MSDFIVKREAWTNEKTNKSGHSYYVPVVIRGQHVRINLVPKENKSTYGLLDIVFNGKDVLPLTIEEGSMTDQSTGEPITYSTLSVVDTDLDESGNEVKYSAELAFKSGADRNLWRNNSPRPDTSDGAWTPEKKK